MLDVSSNPGSAIHRLDGWGTAPLSVPGAPPLYHRTKGVSPAYRVRRGYVQSQVPLAHLQSALSPPSRLAVPTLLCSHQPRGSSAQPLLECGGLCQGQMFQRHHSLTGSLVHEHQGNNRFL